MRVDDLPSLVSEPIVIKYQNGEVLRGSIESVSLINDSIVVRKESGFRACKLNQENISKVMYPKYYER
jgi:hypothetical protein